MLNWTHIGIVERALNLEDDEVNAAWRSVKLALVTPYMGLPPTAASTAQHEAGKLIQSLNKTALSEELFYRYCGLQEAMMGVLVELLPQEHPLRREQAERFADEAFQVSYCDDCGAELGVDGVCGNSGCKVGLAF